MKPIDEIDKLVAQIEAIEVQKVERVKDLNDEIKKLQKKIRELYEGCTHQSKSYYSDYYSKIVTCKDCGMEW